MKPDKFVFQVGKPVEDFMQNLDKPMQLNEMRVMREPNYVKSQFNCLDQIQINTFGYQPLGKPDFKRNERKSPRARN